MVFCLAGALLGVVILFGNPAHADLTLSDVPLSTLVQSPPANIMLVLDDSKSMSCEVLMAGESEGFFPKFDENGETIGEYCYIYNNIYINAYFNPALAMNTEDRKYWKSQHFADNILYYNPNVNYEPWTSYPGQTFAPADRNEPKVHPLKSKVGTQDLDEVSLTVALTIDETSETLLDVKHAHFFVKPDGDDPYLVIINSDGLNYYKASVNGTGLAQMVTIVEKVSSLPQGTITNTVADQRQNFANWFTYHRRREFVAKVAMANTLNNLQGVRVGLLGINEKVKVLLKPVAARINDQLVDEKNSLLGALYNFDSMGSSTPLREGLNDLGRYYESNTKDLVTWRGTTITGDSPPFSTQAEDSACQQCFAIVMTDGYYSYSIEYGKYDPLYSASDRVIGNADGPDNLTDFDRPALQDNLSNTLADVAMYYYENDLQSGLPDRVPTHGFDNASHQHMVTYGVTFGVALEDINPNDYSKNRFYNDDTYSGPWPNDIGAGTSQTITDLWHGTVNSRGNFLTTQNPQQLSDALLEVTESISQELTGSAAAVSFNSNLLRADNQNDTYLFQSSFTSEDESATWSGDVRAYRFGAEIGQFNTGSEPVWSAAEQLQTISWNERNIATYNPINNTGEVFIFDNLTNDQKIDLGWDGESGSDAETTAQSRVEYLKGREIDTFRSRSNKLGDIVHSETVHENDVIYVGANDGMLHAFNNRTFESNTSTNPVMGQELFAYIPNLVFDNLKLLTQPDYNHKYFVDLTPTIAKGMSLLEGNSPADTSGSQTILVGGLRKGGKGYFALDITNPFAMDTASNVAGKVLFEFSETSDMGYSFSQPVVVRSNDDNYPWIIIFGNGYDSTSGDPVLYILDAAKYPYNTRLIKKIILKDDSDNGLSSPTAIDVNFDNVVDYVYVGDLNGNLWKIDLTSSEKDRWVAAYDQDQPLFRAGGPGDSNQPITTKPEVTFHPSEQGYLVMFGTGMFLGESDFSDSSVQTVYGIWDFGDDTDDSEYLGSVTRNSDGAISGLTNLSAKTTLLRQDTTDFEYTLGNFETVDVRILSQKKALWKTESDDQSGENPNPSTSEDNHVGWYFDLSTRERVVTDVALRENKLIIIGFIPDPYRCEPGVGNSWLMEIDAFNGGNLSTVQLDTTGGGTLNVHDLVRLSSTDDLVPPAGIGFHGKLEKASILRIDNSIQLPRPIGDNNGLDVPGGDSSACGEQKYLSSSTGVVRTICEKSINLGMVSWQEVQRD